MRYLKGGNLLTALETGPCDSGATAEMLDQLAQALSAAHQQGIVHLYQLPVVSDRFVHETVDISI